MMDQAPPEGGQSGALQAINDAATVVNNVADGIAEVQGAPPEAVQAFQQAKEFFNKGVEILTGTQQGAPQGAPKGAPQPMESGGNPNAQKTQF